MSSGSAAGGGGTFVAYRDSNGDWQPLFVMGGGGGASDNAGMNASLTPVRRMSRFERQPCQVEFVFMCRPDHCLCVGVLSRISEQCL